MRMALLGEAVAAGRLHALGAISQIEARAGVLPAAMALADRLAAGPTAAQGRIKALVNAAYDADTATQMDAERDAMAEAVAAPEAVEGIAAFLDKRRPDFAGKRG